MTSLETASNVSRCQSDIHERSCYRRYKVRTCVCTFLRWTVTYANRCSCTSGSQPERVIPSHRSRPSWRYRRWCEIAMCVKTREHFHLQCNTKGRFAAHKVDDDDVPTSGVARRMRRTRWPRSNDTLKVNLCINKIEVFHKFEIGKTGLQDVTTIPKQHFVLGTINQVTKHVEIVDVTQRHASTLHQLFGLWM